MKSQRHMNGHSVDTYISEIVQIGPKNNKRISPRFSSHLIYSTERFSSITTQYKKNRFLRVICSRIKHHGSPKYNKLTPLREMISLCV